MEEEGGRAQNVQKRPEGQEGPLLTWAHRPGCVVYKAGIFSRLPISRAGRGFLWQSGVSSSTASHTRGNPVP